MNPNDENIVPESESTDEQHTETSLTENTPSIPVKAQAHRFVPPIHGNKFGGGNNFGNKQRPGRAAQRGR